MKKFVITLLLLTTAACTPVSSSKVDATDTLTRKMTSSPTTNITPPQTTSPIPTFTIVPTPGPDLAVLYIDNGQIKRFDLQTWSEKILPFSNTVRCADISPDGQTLAFCDETGFYLSRSPFKVEQKISGTTEVNIDSSVMSLLFNPDSTLLVLSDSEGLKVLRLADNEAELLANNDLVEGDGSDYINHIPVAWSPDSRYLLVNVWLEEGISYILMDTVSSQFSDLLKCYSNITWLTKSILIGGVYYSRRDNCGFKPGVYRISLEGVSYKETRIFYDQGTLPVYQGFYGLSLSPLNNYAFFFEDTEKNDKRTTYYYLISSNGTNIREITKPRFIENFYPDVYWSPSGQEIYLYTDNDVYLYSLESENWSHIYNSAKRRIGIVAISPDGKWLFLNNYTLHSIETGESLSLVENSSENPEQVFVGWIGTK